MGEKTLSRKLSTTPLYLFGSCLVIEKMAAYHHPIAALWIDLAFLAAYCTLVWLMGRLLSFLTRRRGFMIAGLLFGILFFYADYFLRLLQINTGLFGFHNRDYLLLTLLLCGLVLYGERVFFLSKPVFYLRTVKVTTTALGILLVVALGNLAWQNTRPQHNSAGASFTMGHKNVVWILMDEYASSGILQQYFGYRNELDSFLQQKGFVLLDSMSTRFDQTLFSLNALFNNDDSLQPYGFQTALANLKTNAWTTALQKEHTPFHNLDFIGIGSQPGLQSLYVFPDTYLKQLLYGSVTFNALARRQSLQMDAYNNQVKTSLDSLLRQSPAVPGLVWAHFFIPHQPYLRDATGRLINADRPVTAGASLRKYYIDYLRYGNHQLEDIVQKDPFPDNRILIISGDHGARFPFIRRSDFYRPYCAIRFPKNFDTTGLHAVKYISQLPAFIASH